MLWCLSHPQMQQLVWRCGKDLGCATRGGGGGRGLGGGVGAAWGSSSCISVSCFPSGSSSFTSIIWMLFAKSLASENSKPPAGNHVHCQTLISILFYRLMARRRSARGRLAHWHLTSSVVSDARIFIQAIQNVLTSFACSFLFSLARNFALPTFFLLPFSLLLPTSSGLCSNVLISLL